MILHILAGIGVVAVGVSFFILCVVCWGLVKMTGPMPDPEQPHVEYPDIEEWINAERNGGRK